MNRDDLRVVKTRRNIQDSLFRILRRKSFESVTIQDILEEALINRSTFYRHYSDKYALVESICSSFFNLFKEDVDLRLSNDHTEIAVQYVDHLYQYFYERRFNVLCLLNIKTESIHLYDDMITYLKERFLMQYQGGSFDKQQLDYLATVYASTVMSSIQWCLQNDNNKIAHHFFPAYQSCFALLQRYLVSHT